jgi:hypothetical protein
LGKGTNSRFELSDFTTIDEFKYVDVDSIIICARAFADKWASEARDKLQHAALTYDKIIYVTHVPPFPGATWYKGAHTSPDALPWYTNMALGNVLADVADANPSVQFLVLCGHTHYGGTYDHFDNLRVIVAKATYRIPNVYQVFGQ